MGLSKPTESMDISSSPFHRPSSIPTVTQDIEAQDSRVQTIAALEALQDAAERVFVHLEKRIGSQRQRLSDLQGRISIAERKVESIATSRIRQATTILSSSKFLEGDSVEISGAASGLLPRHLTHMPRSVSLDKTILPHHRIHANGDATHLRSPGAPVASDDTIEIYGHYASVTRKREDPDDEMRNSREGLGKIPAHLDSVDSMLLFNSNQCPYRRYDVLDNLETAGKGEEQISSSESNRKALGDAPLSISGGETLPSFQSEEFGYKPTMGSVPTLNLPTSLPDLPMIAEGVNYDESTSALPSIAPSAVAALLPDILEDELPEENNLDGAMSGAPPPPPSGTNGAAAPPPPPPPPAKSGAPPPPPPPPPPPSIMGSTYSVDDETASERLGPPGRQDSWSQLMDSIRSPDVALKPAQATEDSGSMDSRSALMDAIRNKDVRLKKAEVQQERKPPPADAHSALMDAIRNRSKNELKKVDMTEVEKQKETKRDTGPVDMMSELASRIVRRRSAIAAKEESDSDNGSDGDESVMVVPLAGLQSFLTKEQKNYEDDEDWDD